MSLINTYFWDEIKNFLIAFQFLTIFPIKIDLKIKEKDYGNSLLYFPIIGLLIGGILVLTLFSLDFLPHLVVYILILVLSIFITGAIHLDGFADTCDGFYGAKAKEEILRIMRDNHIGAIGTVGVVCLLLFKFVLFQSIPQNRLWRALIMMMVFSRWSQVLACVSSKYVHQEGKAKFFVENANRKKFFIGGFFTFTIFFLLSSLKGAALFIFCIIPVFLFINFVKRKIGGLTGDTIGAVSEIAECAVLLSIVF
ncbi:MAG: adenosylcobinamide-GDP ribazoletransferase [Candidatus Omnitrophica bacterium]|nr:adenosylcobinamide-GDP ribazoletransferase [Candidatus Omnitrophota bacterium]